MGTKKATEALAAERAAREAEGMFDPTPEQKVALRRWKVLAARKAAVEAEMAAIESQIFSQMGEVGARALVVDGQNVALISPVNKKVVDTEGMARDFPTLVAQYAETVARYTRVEVGVRKAIRK